MKSFTRYSTELRALCRKHSVQLAVSAYDSLQVWPLRDGADELHSAGIESFLPSEVKQ